MIIRPEKIRKYPDPYIVSAAGERGPCALCRSYSKLTQNHVPPQSVGNFKPWRARSYLTSVSGDQSLIVGKRLNAGLRFKTICAECNNGLGANQDKAIASFFGNVRKLVESPIIIASSDSSIKVSAQPNKIYKGLLAHLVSANTDGMPCSFDAEARNVFFGRQSTKTSRWNLFYWIFRGDNIFVMRNAFYTVWSPKVRVIPMHIIKFYPLAFLFTQEHTFFGLPNMRTFCRPKDDEEVDLPIDFRSDAHPIWPVIATNRNLIMMGGNTHGLVGFSD